jgi:chitinase
LLLGLLVIAQCLCPSFAQQRHHERIFAGWFEEWGNAYSGYSIAALQNNGVADHLTHLIYAFANVSASPVPACSVADPYAAYRDAHVPSVRGTPYAAPLYGNFAALQQLKQLHPHLKLLISLGGAAADVAVFQSTAATAEGRARLASSCIEMFIVGNIAPGVRAPDLFDGLHIDWEFPAADDKQNFTALLREFRAQLDALSKETGKHYLLSFESPAGPKNYVNIDLKAAAAQADFLTIDGYDYAGSWDKQTNEASPLYESAGNPLLAQAFSIDETVKAYLKAGVPPAKYTMGIPLYATGWTAVTSANHGLYQTATMLSPVLLADGSGLCPAQSKASAPPGCDPILTPGLLAYSTIQNLAGRNGYAASYDALRVGATLYNPISKTFYSYDNPMSAAAKTAYIRRNKLGGAYVWALGYDDASGSLTKAIAAGLKQGRRISTPQQFQ